VPKLQFSDGRSDKTEPAPAWSVLSVDDDDDIHAATRFALNGFRYRDREVEISEARSAAEAVAWLRDNPDPAVMIIDVVMETHHAGLDLARAVREELGNETTRMVLRTGQAGYAPEMQVTLDYDIDDYLLKSDTDADGLRQSLVFAIRNYERLGATQAFRQERDVVSARFKAVLKAFDAPVAVVDRSGRIVGASQTLARSLGYPIDVVPGIEVSRVLDMRACDIVRQVAAATTERAGHVLCSVRAENGAELHGNARISPLTGAGDVMVTLSNLESGTTGSGDG